MAMRTHPPTGPRAGRNNEASRFTHRGGVQKRGQQTVRVDKDGDLDMDFNGVGRGRGRGRGADHRRSTPNPHTNEHGNPFRDSRRTKVDLSAVQKGVFRVMGKATKGPRASSRLVSNPGQIAGGMDKPAAGGLDQILIRGLRQSKAATNADGGLESLLSWVERKASGPNGESVRVKKSRRNGDDVIISVRPEDTASIIRINNYQFAGANVLIELYQHGVAAPKEITKETTISAEAAEVKALFTNILSRRYNQDMKLLDLSRLGEDPELVQNGLLDTSSRVSKLFPALMGVCDEAFENEQAKTEAITSVSLANNNLINLESVSILAQTFPNIRNLDLSDNKFKNVHSLEKWRYKFTQLEHLVLAGNPIETNDQGFMSVLMSRYPKLRTIGTTQGRPKEEAKAMKSTQTPIPIAPASFEDEADIAKTFLLRFFPAYDTDRTSVLGDYYDNKTAFSINVNTQAPREQSTSTSAAPWEEYIKISRNLLKINHTKARMNRLYEGRENIQPLWNQLPATRHPDLMNESNKWCIECHSLPGVPDGHTPGGVGGLIITAHGEFTEADGKKRSFDRTFILGPGAGIGGIRVVSDMLALRSYGGFETFKPNIFNEAVPTKAPEGPQLGSRSQGYHGPLAHAHPEPAVPQQQPVQPTITQNLALPEGFGLPMEGKLSEQLIKETMAMELTSRTRMTIEYSGLCLAENNWDLDKAHLAFEGAKGSLPQEAFLPF